MPSYLLSRINLDYLYPPFLDALLAMLADANSAALTYFATSGYRSTADQTKLYDKYLKGGPRAAPGGLSAHNYGLAVDLARRVGATGVAWDAGSYAPLAALCSKHGLVWGGTFNDPPHVQWPNYVNGKQLWPLKKMWNKTVSENPNLPEIDYLQVLWQSLAP